MDIKNIIQHYIQVYCGSKDRVIENTMSNCYCNREAVEANIDWLIGKGFVKTIKLSDRTECERSYSESDNCIILRNINIYDETEFLEAEQKRHNYEATLSNLEKFKLYFSRMEQEFDRKNLYNKKTYSLSYDKNIVTIIYNDLSFGKFLKKVDLSILTNITYDETNNSISYKLDNKFYVLELYYLWSDCHLKCYYND